MFDEYFLLFRYVNLRHHYYFEKACNMAELEMDCNPLLSMEIKKKIKKL